MGRALFQLLLVASGGKSGVIPESWQSSVVVPLEKGGDVHDVGNFRGICRISLLSVALKILCTVVGTNLSSVVEEHGVLRREQAGFRKREECMPLYGPGYLANGGVIEASGCWSAIVCDFHRPQGSV